MNARLPRNLVIHVVVDPMPQRKKAGTVAVMGHGAIDFQNNLIFQFLDRSDP